MVRGGRKKSNIQVSGDTPAGGSGSVFRAAFYLILLAGSTLWFPERFYDGFETPKLFAVELLICLALAVWAVWMLVRRPENLIAQLPRPALLLVALFALGLLSVFWSHDRWLALERLLHVSVLAGALFFAWFLYRGKETRAPLLFVAAIGSVLAGWGLLLDAGVPLREFIYPHFKETWSGGQVIDHYRLLTSNQGNPNYLFHILVLTVPLTLGALLQSLARCRIIRRELLVSALLAPCLLLQAACFTYAANRSGLVATTGALLLFILVLLLFRLGSLVRSARKYWIRSAALLLITVASGVVFFNYSTTGQTAGEKISAVLTGGWENWKRRFSTLRSTENIDVYSRVVFLETGAAMAADDPLLGKGVGQFVIQYPAYKTAKHWENFNLIPPEITMWTLIPRQAHNEYLQVLVELGAAGLSLFLAFWAWLGWSVVKLLRLCRDDDSFYLILGAAVGLAGVLANSLLTFPLQTITSALLIWTTSGLLLAACAQAGVCRTAAVRIDPRQPLAGLMLALVIAVAGFGAWGAQRIVTAEHLFFMGLTQHAHDLAYSLRTGKQAADMLPERFEMQYVEGWLGMLAGDTATVRTYLERSIRVAPAFPPPYRFLGEYFFNSGEFEPSEKALKRYGELYPPGRDGNYYLMLGQIAMKDSTRDRFSEISEYLRASDNLQAALYLAERFLEKSWPDSSLSLLQTHRERISFGHSEYSHIYFLAAAAEIARGDSAAARASLDTLFNRGGNYPPVEDRFTEYARQMEQLLK